MLSNMANGIVATETALTSSGSAIEENSKYLDSINGRLAKVGASFEKLSNDTINSNFVKWLLDSSIVLINIIDKIGVLNIALLTTATIIGVKGAFGIGASFMAKYFTGIAMGMGVATKTATVFGNTLTTLFPVAIIIGAVAAINQYNKSIDKTLENQRDIIETSDKNIQNYEQEISKLNTLQKSLVEARGDKEALLSISSQLNSVISDTPGLINGEAEAYDLARQKLIDYRVELENKIKADKKAKLAAQRELYNTNSIDNRFTLDRVPNAGMRVDLNEALSVINLYDDFHGDLYSQELIAKLRVFIEEQVQIAQDIFVDYINQSLPDAASRSAANNFVSELVYGGFNLDQIDIQLEDLIPSIKEINNLKNELSVAKAQGIPTDAIITRFIALIDELKSKFPYMNEYFDTFADNFVSVANGTKIANDEITDYTSVVEKSKETLDDLVKSTDTLNAAFKEQSENGSLSAKTIISIIEAGYGAALQFDKETGKVNLNATAYRELTKAMMDTEVAKLKLAKAGLEANKSKGNPYTWLSGINNLSEDDRKSLSDIEAQIAAYEEINKNIDEIIAGTYGDTSTGGGSDDPYKDAVENQIKDFQYQRDMDIISESEYLNKLDSLIKEKYLTDKKYLDDYQKYEVEIYKGRQRLLETAAQEDEKRAEEKKQKEEQALKDAQTLIDKRLDSAADLFAVHQDENKYVAQLEDILKDVNLSEEQRLKILKEIADVRKDEYKDTLNDLEFTNELLARKDNTEQKQIDNLREMQEVVHTEADRLRSQGFDENSSEIQNLKRLWLGYEDDIQDILKRLNDTITQNLKDSLESQSDLLQEHIDSLQEEQSNLEGSLTYINDLIDKQVSSLEAEKTALQENNDQVSRSIELTKLQNALENARRNKNVRVYDAAQGWTWQADSSKISEAETNLSEWYRAENLRKEIENIDSRISAWQDYKNQWSDVAKNVELENSKIIATNLLGANLESDILNRRASAVEEFGSRYKAVLADIKTAQSELTAVQEQISNVENTSSASGNIAPPLSSFDSSTDYQGLINAILERKARGENKTSDIDELAYLETLRNSKIFSMGLPYEQTSLYGGNHYARGTKDSGDLQIAKTSEFGAEMQLIPAHSTILPANFTDRIWNAGANPVGFVTDNLAKSPLYSSIVSNKNTNSGTSIRIGSISLPNVKNGTDFITELQLYANTHE